jgi:hypothetical protein
LCRHRAPRARAEGYILVTIIVAHCDYITIIVAHCALRLYRRHHYITISTISSSSPYHYSDYIVVVTISLYRLYRRHHYITIATISSSSSTMSSAPCARAEGYIVGGPPPLPLSTRPYLPQPRLPDEGRSYTCIREHVCVRT